MPSGYDMVYPSGLKRKGNLDYDKPVAVVKNKDGSTSTVRTMSIGTEEGEVLIPTVHPDGYIMSDKEARERYFETGENFGIFDSPKSATEYAKKLHDHQSKFIK